MVRELGKPLFVPGLIRMGIFCTFGKCRTQPWDGFQTEHELAAHKIRDPDHYYCAKCKLDFNNWDALVAHRVTSPHHLACAVCGTCFVSESGLRYHIRLYHKKYIDYTCVGCGKAFRGASSVIAHLERGECQGVTKDEFRAAQVTQKYQDVAMQYTSVSGSVAGDCSIGCVSELDSSHSCSSAVPTLAGALQASTISGDTNDPIDLLSDSGTRSPNNPPDFTSAASNSWESATSEWDDTGDDDSKTVTAGESFDDRFPVLDKFKSKAAATAVTSAGTYKNKTSTIQQQNDWNRNDWGSSPKESPLASRAPPPIKNAWGMDIEEKSAPTNAWSGKAHTWANLLKQPPPTSGASSTTTNGWGGTADEKSVLANAWSGTARPWNNVANGWSDTANTWCVESKQSPPAAPVSATTASAWENEADGRPASTNAWPGTVSTWGGKGREQVQGVRAWSEVARSNDENHKKTYTGNTGASSTTRRDYSAQIDGKPAASTRGPIKYPVRDESERFSAQIKLINQKYDETHSKTRKAQPSIASTDLIDLNEEDRAAITKLFWNPMHDDWNPKFYFNPVIEKYVCPMPTCDFQTESETELRSHARDLYTVYDQRCPSCDKRFQSAAALVGHMENPPKRCHVKQTNYEHRLKVASGGFLVGGRMVMPESKKYGRNAWKPRH